MKIDFINVFSEIAKFARLLNSIAYFFLYSIYKREKNMPINAHPEYLQAEKEYLFAETLEEKLKALEKMLSTMPSHKGAKNLRANLKARYKKLKEKILKSKKSRKSTKRGIKKQDMQMILTGFPNTGKSSLFNLLTAQNTKISPLPYTTLKPCLGTTDFEDIKIQTIDTPPFPHEDKNLLNSTDTILLVIDSLEQISNSLEFLKNSNAKIILIFNKSDLLKEEEKRKIQATLDSKFRYLSPLIFSSTQATQQEINELKKELFETFPIIRIYTKEPKKEASKIPLILKKDSTIENTAEKILKGLSKKIKRARIWGPSSKFSGQVVGLEHILKDRDIVEFQTV